MGRVARRIKTCLRVTYERERREMIALTVRHVPVFAGLCVLALLMAPRAPAAELVLFEAADCVWCETWDAEVGGIYPKTEESRVAPLRRVDIHGERPADLAGVRGILYTPTFVLMDRGVEVGRITGYAGEAFFWGLLGVELKKLNVEATAVTRLSGTGEPPLHNQGEKE